MQSIREHIARIKNNFKLTSEDTVVSDRFIYLLMKKHRDFVVKRDRMSKLVYQDNLYQPLNFAELIEVDSVEACNIKTDCKIKRTKEKLPSIVENSYGVIIRWVGSLDGSSEVKHITSNAFQRKLKKKTAKFNKEKYYWFSNGYLYLPNVEWDAIKVDAYFDEDINNDCDEDENCKSKLDEIFRIPEYLVSSMDQLVYQDLSVHVQLPYDEALNDNENLK
jgi:hypothetical protein